MGSFQSHFVFSPLLLDEDFPQFRCHHFQNKENPEKGLILE